MYKIPQFKPHLSSLQEGHGASSAIASNWITEGPECEQFKESLLSFIGADYGIFTPNGTLAIYLALKSLNVGSGDEVIVPALTFFGTASAVEMTGAKPVFVDVNDDFQIDTPKIEEKITKKTKAILPVHLYGVSCDIQEVCKIAIAHCLYVVEDACQGLGLPVGNIGHLGCFSFFADKLITTGEGGFICTNDKGLYETLRLLRNQGRENRGSFYHESIGYNFRITDIQAAIGNEQFKKIDYFIQRRQDILDRYCKNLEDVEQISVLKDYEQIPFRIILTCRDIVQKLMNKLESSNIQTRGIFYPLDRQPYFDNGGLYCNNSYDLYLRGLCLPCYPDLKDDQVDYICDIIKRFYA